MMQRKMITLDTARLYGFKLVHGLQGEGVSSVPPTQNGLVLDTPLTGKIGIKTGGTSGSRGDGEIPSLLGGKIGQKGPPPIVHPE